MNTDTIPQVLYNTADPLSGPSEVWVIHGSVMPGAADPIKKWVVREVHGYWDDHAKKFQFSATTFLPTDPRECESLEEVFKKIEKQKLVRVKQGFKYQFEWDPYEPPFYKKFSIESDGTRKPY